MNHSELARNRQTESSGFEAGGIHCIISMTKFAQEPQHMCHRATLFSVRAPNEDVCPYCVSLFFLLS